jgi:hypothetical protein
VCSSALSVLLRNFEGVHHGLPTQSKLHRSSRSIRITCLLDAVARSMYTARPFIGAGSAWVGPRRAGLIRPALLQLSRYMNEVRLSLTMLDSQAAGKMAVVGRISMTASKLL